MRTAEQKERDREIASIIAQQLGGFGRLQLMINAQNFMYDAAALSFQVKCRGSQFNYVKITLLPSDTYKLNFAKFRGIKISKQVELTDIYAENLRSVVEEHLGLALSLGTMGR